MSAEPLLHVALADEYDAARAEQATHYAPGAFASEGFVHLCRPHQLAGVLARYFTGRDDLVLLALDAGSFDAELREEDTTGRGEAFPHLYGPVPFAAVQAARAIRTDAAGGLVPADTGDAAGAAEEETAALFGALLESR